MQELVWTLIGIVQTVGSGNGMLSEQVLLTYHFWQKKKKKKEVLKDSASGFNGNHHYR